MHPETKEEPKAEVKMLEAPKPYVFPFTMGADPEFTVVSGRRPMNAQDMFQTFFKGMQEGDHGYVVPGGNIGWDNHAATGELRPNPGTPRDVANNLKLMFAEAIKRMPFVDLTTLTISASTGGHIHLSIPDNLMRDLTNASPKWHAIERAVGTFLLMIMMGENSLSREMRRKFQNGNYGDLLDFRTDVKFTHPNGNPGYTLEVRGPTAEWITSEKIAIGTLAYMAIAWDYIITDKLKPIASVIFRSKLQAKDTVLPLMNNFANMQKMYLNKIKPFVRQHPAYKEYKNELELIMSPERTIQEKKRVHYSINEGWGLSSESKHIPTNRFLNEEAIEEATSKFPEGILRNMSQFAWNSDLHVEQFATALSKRCIALGWKPSHEYFLFGMKKGIDALIMRDEDGQFVAGEEVIKTQEDLKVMNKKFTRLNPKAAAIYGRILNHRTGEPMNDRDNHRVMIGIPYTMRQKGNVNPLIRLVVRFEKNPKAFSALVPEKLSETGGALKKIIEEEDIIEQGVQRAEQRGEAQRNLPAELQEEFEAEFRGEVGTDWSNEMREETAEIILNEVNRWDNTGISERELTAILHPGARKGVVEDVTMAKLITAITNAFQTGSRSERSDRVLDSQLLSAYLLLRSASVSGSTILSSRNSPFTHTIKYDGQRFDVSTNGVGTARVINSTELADMLGIGESSFAEFDRMLAQNRNVWLTVMLTRDLIPGTFQQDGQQVIINPGDEHPHFWSA